MDLLRMAGSAQWTSPLGQYLMSGGDKEQISVALDQQV